MAEEGESCLGVCLFLGGLAAGAAVATLMAPRAGGETREMLADWLKEKRLKARGGDAADA